MSRRFHIGELLTITTGHLVTRDVGAIYRICDYVTGVQHMTHQLPRACDVVKPWLLAQHPWLANIVVPDFGITNDTPSDDAERIVTDWVDELADKYGTRHDVEPMPFGMYVGRDPIAELREMAPHAQIIAVELPTDGGR